MKYFDLSFSPNLIELHLLAEQYGIGEMQATNLPENLRGYHYSYNGPDPTILYEQDAWTGRKEHTILHELYEIIQEKFEDLDLGYKKPEDPQISWEADRFAAAVLMQREVFLRALFDTGVDVIQLHHRFGRAYSSIVIRAVELLRKNIDFLVAIYEREEEGDPRKWGPAALDNFLVKYAVRTGIRIGRPKARRYKLHCYPYFLMPEKNDKVMPGSIVEYVIESNQPIYLERVTGFDLWGWNDLTFLLGPSFGLGN